MKSIGIVFVVALLWATKAMATVHVAVSPIAAAGSTSSSVIQVSPGLYDVSITTTYAAAPVTLTVFGATSDSVRSLTLNANMPQIVYLKVAGPTDAESLTSVQTISSDGSQATVLLQLLRASQDVGTIRVNTVSQAYIGGNITGFIECLPRNGGGQAYIDSMIVGGSILGNVTVNHGFINTLTVAGDLGAASTPINVRVKDYISNITARAIYADIRKPDGVELDVEARRIATTAGPFQGALRLRGWMNWTGSGTPGLHIAGGNLDADVVVTGHWDAIADLALGSGYSFVPGRTITIGASLLRTINLPASGLGGQFIIKANNNSAHTWANPVTVGGVSLLPRPYYTNLSSALGGGAVGLVPYSLHKEDCSPPHSPVGGCGLQYSMRTWPASLGGGSRQTIVLRHYGPVTNPPPSLSPCLLERLAITCPYPIACPGPWEEVPAYQVFLPPENPREVWIAL